MLHVLKYVGNFAEEIAFSVLFRLRLKKNHTLTSLALLFFYVIMFKQIKNMRGIQDTPLPSEQ